MADLAGRHRSKLLETFKWPPGVSKRTCEWCTSPVWLRRQFPDLVKLPWRLWYTDLLLDLQYCGDCVNEYHQIQNDFVEINPSKRKELWLGDVERLSLWFKQALDSPSLKSCTTLEILQNLENEFPDIPSYTNADNHPHSLEVQIQEVLQCPQLLFDKRLFQLFEGAVLALVDSGTPPVLLNRYPGIYILLLNKSAKLRKWAEKAIKRLPKIALTDYDLIASSIQSMIEVAVLNLFENGDLLDDAEDYSTTTYLPSHLFGMPFVYWWGFLRLLLSMEREVITEKLMGVEGHRELADAILNVIDGSLGKEKAVFWPAFNCFILILDSCGSRLWPILTRSPQQVFDIIVNHQVYIRDMKQYSLKSSGTTSDQVFNSSQDCQVSSQEFVLESQGTSGNYLPKTAHTWFQVFAESLLDFDDVAEQCIPEIITTLDSYPGKLDIKVKIVDIVCIVMRSNHLSALASTAQLWVPHLLELAIKLDETDKKVFYTIIKPAREKIKELLAKSNHSDDIDFKQLTDGEIEDLTQSIISRLKSGEAAKRKPTTKHCARKSMKLKRSIKTEPPDYPPAAENVLQLQLGTTPRMQSQRNVEEKYCNRNEQQTTSKDERYNQVVSGIGKLKASLDAGDKTCTHPWDSKGVTVKKEGHTLDVNGKNTAHLIQKPLIPVIKLEDCLKSGHKNAGSKDKPICLDDSDDDFDMNSSIKKTTSPVPSFAMFKARSKEKSNEKLKKISSKVANPQTSTPQSTKSKARKRSLNFTKIRKDSNETSSPDDSSDEDFELQVKKSPKRRKKVILDSDGDDDTESLEDDKPLYELCKERLTPKRKAAHDSKHQHRHESRISNSPTSTNTSCVNSISPHSNPCSSQVLRSASPCYPKSSTPNSTTTITTNSHMTQISKSQQTDFKLCTSSCADIPKSPSPHDKSLVQSTKSSLERSSSITVSEYKAMAITNINIDKSIQSSSKNAFLSTESLELKTSQGSVKREDLKDNTSCDGHSNGNQVTQTLSKSYSHKEEEDNQDVKPLLEKLDHQRIVYSETKRRCLTAGLEKITHMIENFGVELMSEDGNCAEDLGNDVSMSLTYDNTEKDDSAGESSESDSLCRYDQLIHENVKKYGSENFLENLVRGRSEDELTRDEILSTYKDNIDTSQKNAKDGDITEMSKLPDTKIMSELDLLETEKTNTNNDENVSISHNIAQDIDHVPISKQPNIQIKSEFDLVETKRKNKNSDGKIVEICDDLFDPEDDKVLSEIDLGEAHHCSSTKKSLNPKDKSSSSSAADSLDSIIWEDLDVALEDSKRKPSQQIDSHTVNQSEQDTYISETEDDVFLREVDLDIVAQDNVLTGVKVEKGSENVSSDDEMIQFSLSELMDDDVGLEPTKESNHNNEQNNLVSSEKEEVSKWNGHGFNANQTESVFASVEAEISSTDEESDDDLVEIFCSQSFKQPLVNVKIEKVDDENLETTKAEVETKAEVTTAQTSSKTEQQHRASPCQASTTAPPPAPPKVVAQASTIFTEKPADVVCTLKLTEDHLVRQVLSWQAEWLNTNNRAEVAVYKVLENAEKLPKTFDSMDEYCTSFGSLLVVEAWEKAFKEWRDPRCCRGIHDASVRNVSNNRSYKIIRCSISDVSLKSYNDRVLPEEKDLVQITIDGYCIFGLVERVDTQRVCKRVSSSSDLNESYTETTFNITLTIKTCTSLNPHEGMKVQLEAVTSLLTTFREWSAMISFSQHNLLDKDILRPRGVKYFCSDDKPNDVTGNEIYNESQVRVIETVAEAVKQPIAIPRICLVQGPPGTGKSHTIVGMVTKILNQRESLSSQNLPSRLLPDKPRILICCPSNEGTDEIIRKLIKAKPRLTTPNNSNKSKEGFRSVNCGDFSLVRVGRMSKISESVKGTTLEHLVKHFVQTAGYTRNETSTARFKRALKKIDHEIESLEKEKFVLNRDGSSTDNQKIANLDKLEQERSDLFSKRQTIVRDLRKEREKQSSYFKMESKIRKEILNNADIICSTLSSSASPVVMSDLRGSDGMKIPFSCVIVDEACQCTELDTLIPLQYKSSKLILVGDPEQLPATVISKDAKKLMYGRSLFGRLYRYFKELPRNERPVHLLNTQYRMHPEIAFFPNEHVYVGHIKNDSSVMNRSFPIKNHYALFNVHRGIETNDRKGSISNRREAYLIQFLCSHLLNRQIKPSDIGIITPYRAQLIEIRQLLRNSVERFKEIEVNTVDGFQGREKNIIVMSCVRSADNIGFLECKNRLNVAITRARHALYVFGNLDSLRKAEFWKKLVDDANHRGLIFKANHTDDVKRAISLTTTPSKHISTHDSSDRLSPTSEAEKENKHSHYKIYDNVDKRLESASPPAHTENDSRTVNTDDKLSTRLACKRRLSNASSSTLCDPKSSVSLNNVPPPPSNRGKSESSTNRSHYSSSSNRSESYTARKIPYSSLPVKRSHQHPSCFNASDVAASASINHSSSSSHKRKEPKASEPYSSSSSKRRESNKTASRNHLSSSHNIGETCAAVTDITSSSSSKSEKRLESLPQSENNTTASKTCSSSYQKRGESSIATINHSSSSYSKSRPPLPPLMSTNLGKCSPKWSSPACEPTATTSNIQKRRHSSENAEISPKKVHFHRAYVTLFTEQRMPESFSYSIKDNPTSAAVDTGAASTDGKHFDDYDNNWISRRNTTTSTTKNPYVHQETHLLNGSIDGRYKNHSMWATERHITRVDTTQAVQQPSNAIHTTSTEESLTTSENSLAILPQEVQGQPHQMTEHQTNTTNDMARRLDEVTTHVREKTIKPRSPVVISPSSYRGGRGGRLLSMDNQGSTPAEQLRDWHPHGGPRERIAPNRSNLVQSTRSRGVQGAVVEDPRSKRRRKRDSLRQNFQQRGKRSRHF